MGLNDYTGAADLKSDDEGEQIPTHTKPRAHSAVDVEVPGHMALGDTGHRVDQLLNLEDK